MGMAIKKFGHCLALANKAYLATGYDKIFLVLPHNVGICTPPYDRTIQLYIFYISTFTTRQISPRKRLRLQS